MKSASACDFSEAKIPNGPNSTIGKTITKLFKKKNKLKKKKFSSIQNEEENDDEDEVLNEFGEPSTFERPVRREFIMRSSVSRPAPYSRQSPQRMYCLLTNSEFRLAGAFTEDTMFF